VSTPDWDQRRLCPDGACVGVLDDAGVCKVCGTPGGPALESASVAAALEADSDDDDEYEDDDEYDDDEYDDDADDDADADPDEPDAAGAPAAGSPGWTDRALCPDGGCIGVIGDDGACKVCGKRAA